MPSIPICQLHHDHAAKYVCCRHKRCMCNDCKELCADDCPLINVSAQNVSTLSLNARVVILNDQVNAGLQDTEKRIADNDELKEKLVKKARDHYNDLKRAMEKSTDKIINDFLDTFSEKSEKVLKERNKILHDAQKNMKTLLDAIPSTDDDEMAPDVQGHVQELLREENKKVIGSIDHTIVQWFFKGDTTYGNTVLTKPIGFFYDLTTYEDLEPISDPKEVPSPEKRNVTEGREKENSKSGKKQTKKTPTIKTADVAINKSKSEVQSNESHSSVASPSSSSRLPKPRPPPKPERKDGNKDESINNAMPSTKPEDKNVKKAPSPKPPADYFFVQAHANMKSPCSYDIVKILSEGRIILFDSAHGEFLIVHYDGLVEGRGKFRHSMQHLTVMDDNTFAVLLKNGSSIRILQSERGNIKEIRKMDIRKQTKAIGFEFDPSCSQFAIVITDRVDLLSSDGKTVDGVDFEMYQTQENALAAFAAHADATKLKGIYKFENRKVVLLNKEHRIIQCISPDTGLLWKRKIDDDRPYDVVTDDGNVYVLFTTCVVLFSGDGSPIRKYATAACPEGARAFCIDRHNSIMVLTSNSTVKAESRKMFTLAASS